MNEEWREGTAGDDPKRTHLESLFHKAQEKLSLDAFFRSLLK